MLTGTARAPTEQRDEKKERVARAAVDAVYARYCSNSIAELEAAVVALIGVPIGDDEEEEEA